MFDRIAEEAFAVEQVHFKKTKKRTNPKKADPFMVLPGTVPLLVSAPHSVRQVRNGKIKRSAENTGSLAYLLNRETGCHAIAVKKLYGGDPDWDERCIYKERLRGLVNEHNIRLVLDLHGAVRESEFDIALASPNPTGLRDSSGMTAILKKHFCSEGILSISEMVFPPANQHCISHYCTDKLGVSAVQIQINHRYRVPNRNGADFSRLLRALTRAIQSFTAPR